MIAEIQNAAARSLDDLSHFASIEARAGWEVLESAYLSLEGTAMSLDGAPTRTVKAVADRVAGELGAGYVLLRKLF